MQESNPLVLEILKQDKALKMGLFRQKEVASTLRIFSQCQVNFTEIDRLCFEVAYILNKSGQNNSQEADFVSGLRKAGQLLWDHLLTKQVKDELRATQITDLVLCVDEELVNIPWELLFDGSNFLCLNFNLGRVVRTREQVSPVQYRSASSVLKMMILANPTDDLKSSYTEGLSIKNQFDRKRNNVRIDFKSTCIERLYVKKNLHDYDIVHFAGHCEFSPDADKSGWVLADGRFGVQDILALGQTKALASLVFSNACYSAKIDSSLVDTDYQEKNYSLASAFLFSGVRHYIGAIRRIEDPISLTFAKEFYAQLISGRPVGESIRLGRLKLIREYGITNIAWTSYLLYGDPNFSLLKAALREPKPRLSNRIFLNKKLIAWLTLTAAVISLCVGLCFWIPTINPSSYVLYLKAQGFFQKGNNDEVIKLSSQIIKNDPAFLAAYPLLADTYHRKGDRENALKYYFDYALISETKSAQRDLACSYLKIGWFYHLQGDYQKAVDFYDKALQISQKNNDKLSTATALRKLAVWNIDNANYDRALELLTKSAEINRSRLNIYEHRYNLACDYFDLGLVFSNKNDFSAARDFYNKSRALFEKLKLKNELGDYYFNLGEICLFEKQYQKALDFYLRGLKIDQTQGNRMNLASDYNMVGELYVEMDNAKEAEKYFGLAAQVSQEINLPPELANSFYNLGLLYKKLGRKNKARENLRQAQEIYSKVDRVSYDEVKNELLNLE